jgi:hypothetical protein
VYSALALTLGAKPAYAASCDCAEERSESNLYCEINFGDIRLYTGV